MTPYRLTSPSSSSSPPQPQATTMSTTMSTATTGTSQDDGGKEGPSLPTFRYNAKPLESIRRSSSSCSSTAVPVVCACCRRDRGYLYTTMDGTVEVCPWCLADGRAHRQFPDAIMNDCDLVVQSPQQQSPQQQSQQSSQQQQQQQQHYYQRQQVQPSPYQRDEAADGILVDGGGDGIGDGIIPKRAWHELIYQTPRFIAWQDTLWWTHCDDAAVYQGMGGWDEIQAAGPEAAAYFLRYYVDEFHGEEGTWEAFARQTGKDYDRTAYLFSCRHCRAWGGYIDMR